MAKFNSKKGFFYLLDTGGTVVGEYWKYSSTLQEEQIHGTQSCELS